MLTPRPRTDPWEWGKQRVYPQTSGHPGKRNPDLTPYTKAFILAAHGRTHKRVVLVISAQSGKALALDTKLPTPSGWTTMGNVSVGDTLFDEHGKPCKVIATSAIMENHSCYDVVFSDGSVITADADHLWTVQKVTSNNKVMTLTTAQLLAGMSGKKRSVWAIPCAGALALPEQDLPVDPYALGVWLGDGHKFSANVCLNAGDASHFMGRLRDNGVTFAVRRDTAGAVNLTLGPQSNPLKNGTMMSCLRALGVLKNKHIPNAYLRASEGQRRRLLQGLLDTYGYVCRNGRIEIAIANNPDMAAQVYELAVSLGLKPRSVGKIARYGDKVTGTYSRLTMHAYQEDDVITLPRKAERLKSRNDEGVRPSEACRRFITDIVKVDSVPVRCVKIDTPTSLYLAGEGMIPTHNTESLFDLIGERLDTSPVPIIYVGPSKQFLQEQLEPRIEELLTTTTLRNRLGPPKKQKLTKKLVSGVYIRLAHGGSTTAMKSDPFGLAVTDEADEIASQLNGQGNPIGLIDNRGDTYPDFVHAITSTPSVGTTEVEVDPESGLAFWADSDPEEISSSIWRLWLSGTRYHWAWPCPHCREYFIPRFECLKWERPVDARGRELQSSAAVAAKTAHLVCPNGCIIHEDEDVEGSDLTAKEWMNSRGVYVAPGQSVDTDGTVHGLPPESWTLSYWVSGLCSPFVKWGVRAARYVEAVRSGNMGDIQKVRNQDFGELWAPGSGSAPEWTEVQKKATGTYQTGEVPDDVLVLTLGCDVQPDRLVYTIRGWGAYGKSYLIEADEIYGPTEGREVWDTLSGIITDTYDGLPIKLALIDSGFRPGKKEVVPEHRVYEFARRHPDLVRATKGSSVPMRKPIAPTKVDITIKGKTIKSGLELLRLDPDYFKSWVHQKVRWDETLPGDWRLPADVSEEYCRQIVSEARIKAPGGKVKWVVRYKQNHFLDCEALQAAAATILNLAKLRPISSRAEEARGRPGARRNTEASDTPPPKPTGGSWMGRRKSIWS